MWLMEKEDHSGAVWDTVAESIAQVRPAVLIIPRLCPDDLRAAVAGAVADLEGSGHQVAVHWERGGMFSLESARHSVANIHILGFFLFHFFFSFLLFFFFSLLFFE